MSPFWFMCKKISNWTLYIHEIAATTEWVWTCCAHGERLNDHGNKVGEEEEEDQG